MSLACIALAAACLEASEGNSSTKKKCPDRPTDATETITCSPAHDQNSNVVAAAPFENSNLFHNAAADLSSDNMMEDMVSLLLLQPASAPRVVSFTSEEYNEMQSKAENMSNNNSNKQFFEDQFMLMSADISSSPKSKHKAVSVYHSQQMQPKDGGNLLVVTDNDGKYFCRPEFTANFVFCMPKKNLNN